MVLEIDSEMLLVANPLSVVDDGTELLKAVLFDSTELPAKLECCPEYDVVKPLEFVVIAIELVTPVALLYTDDSVALKRVDVPFVVPDA